MHRHDDHSHIGHHHAHPDDSSGIAWAFFLNISFAIVELICGFWFNSAAILGEAVHDFGDSFAIAMAWWFQKISAQNATSRFTYGFRRFSLFAALLNGMILLLGSLGVLWFAVSRLTDPVMPNATGMFALAILGVLVNGYAAFRVSKGSSVNAKMVNWHLLEDVLGWVAILLVSILLQFFHWPILDPLLSIAFAVFIIYNVVRLLRHTLRILFQAVPDEAVLQDVTNQVEGLPGVERVHHAHFWSLDGTSHVFTAHVELQIAMGHEEQVELKQRIAELLRPYGWSHTTIELELPGEVCRDHRSAKLVEKASRKR